MQTYRTNSVKYPKYVIDKDHNQTLVELSDYDGQGFKIGTSGGIPTGLDINETIDFLYDAWQAAIKVKAMMIKDKVISVGN